MENAPLPKKILVNGAELSYFAQGGGDPIVFVHGTLGDFRDWLELATPFAEQFRTMTYSRRAHYPNAWPADYSSCSPEVHAADLAALLETLGTGPVHLFGHSYGGLVSLVFATQRPDLVRTLTLGEPPLLRWLEATAEGRAVVADFTANSLVPARRAFEQGEMEEGVRAFIDGAVGEGAFDELPPPVQASLMDNAPEMQVEMATPLEITMSSLSREDVARLRMPVLLLTGELSRPMFLRGNEELARRLPHAEQAVIPGVSHDLWNPPVLQETLLEFMGRH